MKASGWLRRWTARRRAADRALTTAAAAEWLRSYQALDASGGMSSAERYSLTGRTGLEPLINELAGHYSLTERTGLEPLASPERYALTIDPPGEDDPGYVSPAVVRASRAYAASAGLLSEDSELNSLPSDPLVFGPEYRLPLSS